VDPVLRADTPVHEYDPGTWGPPMHRSFPLRLARAVMRPAESSPSAIRAA